ncbi:MAG: hypothetical protein L6R40_008021 [Gallowayella cf. fulva]|nr:MAG: hypothetical protein L6R40_008021 [Xanthomendoza cf. fulva]
MSEVQQQVFALNVPIPTITKRLASRTGGNERTKLAKKWPWTLLCTKGLMKVNARSDIFAGQTSGLNDKRKISVNGARETVEATCDQFPSGIELRILPLGSSIVAGDGSSDENGFLAHLQDDLAGWKMEYVGTLRSGSMANNYHEGHSGFTISQGRGDYNGSTQRLGSLLDFLLEKLPDATVLVCQIIGARDAATNSRINDFNTNIPRLVEERPGKHIIVVNMTVIQANQLVDGTHPNDPAYRVMARIFYEGIVKALELGWVKAPSGPHWRPDPNLTGPMCYDRGDTGLLKMKSTRTSYTSVGDVLWNSTDTAFEPQSKTISVWKNSRNQYPSSSFISAEKAPEMANQLETRNVAPERRSEQRTSTN